MNRVSQFFGAAAVIAIAVVFILQFNPASGHQGRAVGPPCAIEIQGGCVETGHYWAAYRLLAGRMDGDMQRELQLRRHVTEGLIERWILNLDAKRLGVRASDRDITFEIVAGRARVSLPVEQTEILAMRMGMRALDGMNTFIPVAWGKTEDKKFEAFNAERDIRRDTGLSSSDFREFMRQELVAARIRDLVLARVHVGETEAFEEYALKENQAKVSVARFDREFYADVMVDRSDAAVSEWAKANTDEADKAWNEVKEKVGDECRVTRQIVASLDEAATEDEKKKAKALLAQIEKKLAAGESFADVATKYSQDAESAKRGGSLGCVLKGSREKPVDDALWKLEEGKTSAAIESPRGYHLLHVEKILKKDDAAKAAKLDAHRAKYVKFEAEKLAAEGAKAVLAGAKGKTLQEALDAYLKDLQAKQPKAHKEEKKGEKKDEKKGDGKKDDGKGDGKKGEGKKEEGKKEEGKKDEKKGDGKKEEGKKDDEKKADKKDDEKKDDGKKDEDVKLEANPEWTFDAHEKRPRIETSGFFARSGQPITDAAPGEDLAKVAFELAKPGDLPSNVAQTRAGYAVMTLKEKRLATKEDFQKERASYLSRLRMAKQREALIGYVKGLRSKLATEVKLVPGISSDPAPSKSGQPAPDYGMPPGLGEE